MCDSLWSGADASADRRSWFAKNSDRPVGEPQRLEWHPPRRDGDPLRVTHITVDGAGETLGVLGSRPDWMWGFEHGVNTAGVAIGNERVFTTDHPGRAEAALTGMDLVRLALERAASAPAAVEVIGGLLDRYGQGGTCMPGRNEAYWSSFLVADASEGFVVETSGSTWVVEPAGGARAISNRLDIDAFDERVGIQSELLDLCVDGRLARTRATVADGADLASIRAVLRSHEVDRPEQAGWTVCMHVTDDQVTAASMIVDLAADPPVARIAAGSPCRSPYVPLVVGRPVGDPPAWERFAELLVVDPAELSALEDRLEAAFDPDDPAWPDRAWAQVVDELPLPAS